MAVPNLKHIVDQVYARGGWELSTKQGCGLFTEACAIALHLADANFGHLLKRPSRNHVVDSKGRRHAVDAVLYKSPIAGQSVAVDLIASSETPSAKPAWTLDKPRYSPSDWFAPDLDSVPAPDPEPQQPPSGDAEIAAVQARLKAIEDWIGSFRR